MSDEGYWQDSFFPDLNDDRPCTEEGGSVHSPRRSEPDPDAGLPFMHWECQDCGEVWM